MGERLALEVPGLDGHGERLGAVVERSAEVALHGGDHAEEPEHLADDDRVLELRGQHRGPARRAPSPRRGRRGTMSLHDRPLSTRASSTPPSSLGVGHHLLEQGPLALVVALLGRDPAAEEQRRGALLGRASSSQRLLVVAVGGVDVTRAHARLGHRRQRVHRRLLPVRSPELEGLLEVAPGRRPSCRRRATCGPPARSSSAAAVEISRQTEVQRDETRVLGDPLAGVVAHPPGDEAVQSSAIAQQHRLVGHVPQQRVLERVLDRVVERRARRCGRRARAGGPARATSPSPRGRRDRASPPRRPRTPGRPPTSAATPRARRGRGCRGASAARRSTSAARARGSRRSTWTCHGSHGSPVSMTPSSISILTSSST